MMNDAPGTTRVSIAIPGKAAADVAVPAARAVDFCREAKRRGLLVRYRQPDAFELVDDPLFELRERVKQWVAENSEDRARDLAEVETADEAKLREMYARYKYWDTVGEKSPIDGELA